MLEIDKIICGDCLEELPAIPEDSIDTVVCDPPYELAAKEGPAMPRLFDPFMEEELSAMAETLAQRPTPCL